MALVGELVLTRNQLLELSYHLESSELQEISRSVDLITSDLQNRFLGMRMQPVQTLWKQLPRVVRETASSLNKKANLEMIGADTELDKAVLDLIKDPMIHMVRNSISHGIEAPDERLSIGKPEMGTIVLHASHEAGNVIIDITDDGQGIDISRLKKKIESQELADSAEIKSMTEKEILDYIFLPGFSTAESVSNLAGRGVGMDVVKNSITQAGGTLQIINRPGEGLTFRLKLPLTLAIMAALVVRSNHHCFAIPHINVSELVLLEKEQYQKSVVTMKGGIVLKLRDKLLPFISLSAVLKENGILQNQNFEYKHLERLNIVILHNGNQEFALLVDTIQDYQEIVIKPLSKLLKTLPYYAGATIMGDGSVGLILDIPGLAEVTGIGKRAREENETGITQKLLDTIHGANHFLVFESYGKEPFAFPLLQVTRLEKILISQLEQSNGNLVLQYRDGILPVFPVQQILDHKIPLEQSTFSSETNEETAHIIVCERENTSFGVLAKRIVDVVDKETTDSGTHEEQSILAGRVTRLLYPEQIKLPC